MSAATAKPKKKHVGLTVFIVILVLLLLIVAAVGAFGYYKVVMEPQRIVDEAKALIEEGDYLAAYQLLKDAKYPAVFGSEQLTEKQTGIGALQEELVAAHPTLTLQNAKVGDVVTYGHYEQDGNTENGAEALEWIVLAIDEDNGRMLVVTRYCVDCQAYNDSGSSTTWKDSSIRAWLNKKEGKYAFYGNAFSDIEKSFIFNKRVETPRNPQYYTSGGSKVDDHVFLLSAQEVEEYFADDAARMCEPTLYARRQGSYVKREGDYTTTCRWWLRTSGETADKAVYVGNDGSINLKGGAVEGSGGDGRYGSYSGQDKGSVRPAMWIKLDE